MQKEYIIIKPLIAKRLEKEGVALPFMFLNFTCTSIYESCE